MGIMHQAATDQRVHCLLNSDAEPSQLPASQVATDAVVDSFRNLLQPNTQPAPGPGADEGIASMAAVPARCKKPTYARLGVAIAHHKSGDDAAGASDMVDAGPKRLKIRNRFRAGVFRRCCFISAHETQSSLGADGVKDILKIACLSCCSYVCLYTPVMPMPKTEFQPPKQPELSGAGYYSAPSARQVQSCAGSCWTPLGRPAWRVAAGCLTLEEARESSRLSLSISTASGLPL